MKTQARRHVIDLIFPIALFFVFAASAILVLVLASDIYRDSTESSQINDESRTALSYISEKMRRSDESSAFDIQEVDGTSCLVISEDYNGTLCHTYIYVYEDMLKELFVQDGVDAPLGTGTDILPATALSMEETQPGIFSFTCERSDGATRSIIFSERSGL